MIHETAVIESGAELGADVSVGPFTFIESGAHIGAGCRIGPHATVYGSVTLGRECRVHAGAILGDDPQDTGFKGGESFVRIGDHCVIREGVTVHRGTKEGTGTEIGNHCFLMALSHFAHNVKLADRVIVANAALLGGYVEIGERTFVSGNVAVHQFVKVGRLAMLGGGAGVSKDVPPFCMLNAVALNQIIGLNVVGMRRAGMSVDERSQVQRAFKVLFLSGLNATQARERIAEVFAEGPALEFCRFLETSTRGLCACAIQREGPLEV